MSKLIWWIRDYYPTIILIALPTLLAIRFYLDRESIREECATHRRLMPTCLVTRDDGTFFTIEAPKAACADINAAYAKTDVRSRLTETPSNVTFTWTEPEGYNQPSPDVRVEGMADGGAWAFCKMSESAPGSGTWTCDAPISKGSSLVFNVAHMDSRAIPTGVCYVFDQCASYCGGKGSNFGKITLTRDGVEIPFALLDNGVDAFACTLNGVIEPT